MKLRKSAAIWLAAAMLMTGCSAYTGNDTASDTSAGEVTHTQGAGFSDDSTAVYPDVQLPFATEYYLDGESEQTVNACKAIYSAMLRGDAEADISPYGMTRDKIDSLVMLIVTTAPQLNNIKEDYSYTALGDGTVSSVRINYTVDSEENKAMTNELLAKAHLITAEAEGLPEHEKVRLFHDRLVLGCEYTDESPNCYTAYGCLVEGKAVCEGYSKAFLLLCELADIDCVTVLGTAGGDEISHMWNKVCLDGEWYNTDVTWDDPITTIGVDYVRYDYFNITDAELLRDHIFDDSGYIRGPEATGTVYGYFAINGLLVTDIAEAGEMLEDAVITAAGKDMPTAEIKTAGSELFDEVYNEYFEGDTPKIFEVLKSAAEQADADFATDSYSVLKNASQNTITVILR